jgi:NAD(P)-dependent dehydrogenase (short-subunit alcohol dehydrogenase family)
MGQQLVLQLARLGARVAYCDYISERLAETDELLKAAGVAEHTRAFQVDVSDFKQMKQWADTVRTHFGDADALINNAGVSLRRYDADQTPLDDFHWIMNINFWGVVHGTQAFTPQLTQREEAWITNISSIFGMVGMKNNAAYCSSKFAVRGFTEVMRMERWGTKLNLLGVHPGGVKTNIVRYGKDQESFDIQAFDKAMARTSPEDAARQIIEAMAKRKKRLVIGPDGKQMDWLTRLFPVKYSGILKRILDKKEGQARAKLKI